MVRGSFSRSRSRSRSGVHAMIESRAASQPDGMTTTPLKIAHLLSHIVSSESLGRRLRSPSLKNLFCDSSSPG